MASNEDLEAVLAESEESEAAAGSEESETESEAAAAAEDEVEEKSKGNKATASDRIQKLSGKVKDLETEKDSLSETITARDQEIQKLVDLLELRERDSRIVEKINEIYETGSDELKASIDSLNNAIMGVEEAVEETEAQAEEAKEAGDTKALKELQRLRSELDKTKSALNDQLEDQSDQLILDKADRLIDNLFAELPDTYTEDDKRVLAEAVVDRVNWEAIEEDNSVLQDAVAAGFESTLEWYGKPRGDVATETKENQENVKKGPTLDQLREFDWGKLKSDGDKAKPAISDDVFTDGLAEALRKVNEAERALQFEKE